MNNYQKFGLVAGQVLLGLSFGVAGLIVGALAAYLFFELADSRLELYSEIMYAMIGGYIGTQAGVAFEGFRFLKRYCRQKEFVRFLAQSVIGTIAALVILSSFVVPMSQGIAIGLMNFLMAALPLLGAIVGFNLRFISSVKQTNQK